KKKLIKNISADAMIERLCIMIVLLFIILITILITICMIDKHKKKLIENNIQEYIQLVEKEIETNKENNIRLEKATNNLYTIKELNIKYNNIKIKNGILVIERNKVTDYDIILKNYEVIKDKKTNKPVVLIIGSTKHKKLKIMSEENNACIITKNQICSKREIKEGLSVMVNVAPSLKQKFYVISNTKEKVTLIMNENIGIISNWSNINNNSGPNMALKELEKNTSKWNKIPDLNYDISGLDEKNNQRYEKTMLKKVKARLLTYEEAIQLGCTNKAYSCPTWLNSNLSAENVTKSSHGFWTSTPFSASQAWFIYYKGLINNYDVNTNIGIRPVIEINKY
ncbi:MAG: hypothetical protein RR703_01945, partial [Bacilli bacterium]